MNKPWKTALALSALLMSHAPRLLACGCFAPPSPATPVVQAGERILFAQDGANVTAYIQLQYQGAAADFGWLVPLPSVPTLEVGSDELFTQLLATTSPSYVLSTTRDFCGGGSSTSVGCGGATSLNSAGSATSADAGAFVSDAGTSSGSPLVLSSSIGPYDYAVLKADNKTTMLDWLTANHYYVPDATGTAVTPYIHPGAYFLALKLASGEAAGNVVPIVLRYESDLPMVPITLTQVGAIPDMGILVWLLGDARAIPRNYYSVVLDEMPVWNDVTTYPAAAIRAVHDAPKRHAFLTEYAGPSSVMANQLDYPGRFGNLAQARTLTNPYDYLGFLRYNGFTYDSTLFAILEKYVPEPASAIAQGVSEAQYYASAYQYLSPEALDAGTTPFDAGALTDEITSRIVVPDQQASKLFSSYPYLTRMYTALSPADMNVDPVFSQNPDLPEVPLVHSAQLTYPCEGDAWLRTDSGEEAQFLSGTLRTSKTLPGALRVETLREEGPPLVVTDNSASITAALGKVSHGSSPDSSSHGAGSGCDVRSRFPRSAAGTALLVAGAIYLSRRRRKVA
ncbi:MAG: DUF2330 domain-containing protein [Polyangia bacterium]